MRTAVIRRVAIAVSFMVARRGADHADLLPDRTTTLGGCFSGRRFRIRDYTLWRSNQWSPVFVLTQFSWIALILAWG